jgi:hypothetical protein
MDHFYSAFFIGNIEHVITLMIRQVALEQPHRPVEFFHQSQLLDHQMNRTQDSTTHPSAPLPALVVNVARREHRIDLVTPPAVSEPIPDSILAVAKIFAVISFHSKRPLVLVAVFSSTTI